MEGQTVLFVLLSDFADWEIAPIAAVLNEGSKIYGKKYQVKTVTLREDSVRSIGGLQVVPDYHILDVPDEYAGVILIGGTGWKTDTAKRVLPLVYHAIHNNLVVGAICEAAEFLALNGLLNEVQHTANDLNQLTSVPKSLYYGSKNYFFQQTVRDGNIITANSSASLEFGREILRALEAAPDREIDDWYDFFKLGYYDAMAKKKILRT